jgi:hypothetical protein
MFTIANVFETGACADGDRKSLPVSKQDSDACNHHRQSISIAVPNQNQSD